MMRAISAAVMGGVEGDTIGDTLAWDGYRLTHPGRWVTC